MKTMRHQRIRFALGAALGLALAAGLLSGCWPAEESAPAAVPAAGATRAQVDEAVGKVFPALVRIYVVGKYHDGGREQKSQSSGSGAIITPDGYAITNHHVVGKA